jgi:HSP20 family protein
MAAFFPDPFAALFDLQQALDAFRASRWLEPGPSGAGGYPPLNVFRKGDDYVLLAEVPGLRKADLEVQVKGDTIRLAGTKSIDYGSSVSMHRRERVPGRFDRAVTIPVEIDAEGIRAECRDGILAVFLPRSERDKPKSIAVQ